MAVNKLYDALYGDRMIPELQSRMLDGIDSNLSQTSLNSLALLLDDAFPNEYQFLKKDISQLGISAFQQPIQVHSNIEYVEYMTGLVLDDVIGNLDNNWQNQIVHNFLHGRNNTESVMIPRGWGSKPSYSGTLCVKGVPNSYDTQIIQGGSMASSNFPIQTLTVDELITAEFEPQLHKAIQSYIGKLQQTIQGLSEVQLDNVRKNIGIQAS